MWVACGQRIFTKLTTDVFFRFSLVAITTWLCVSPKTTTLTVTGLVVLHVVFYFLMERKHSNSTEGRQQATYKDVEYEKIPEGSNTDTSTLPVLTRDKKLNVLKEICPSMVCVVISWLSEFLVMQAVIMTYAFSTHSSLLGIIINTTSPYSYWENSLIDYTSQ